jgi:gluconate:H+ symporter, GntP family
VLPAILAIAIVALIVLIARVRLHAFLALMLVSAFTGLAAGLPPAAIAGAFQEGVGSTLGFTAVVISLGAIFGKLLADSGGASVVARAITGAFSADALPWAVAAAGFLVGLPVFFSVGLVLLVPVVWQIASVSGRPFLSLALPLVAGLSASHGLVAPHPGPIAAIERLGADPGRSIVYGILAGLPAMIIAGPVFLRVAPAARRAAGASAASTPSSRSEPPSRSEPSATLALFMILLPVILMLCATLADATLVGGNPVRRWIDFCGAPSIAMLIATLAGYYVFGTRCGRSMTELAAGTESALLPLASVLLIVGAGGGFGRVLDRAGAGQALAAGAAGLQVSPLLIGWMVAALLRVAVGSATVAITTAASLVAPVAAAVPGTSRELLVVALGAGSLIASHVNDGGFWLVKEYLGLDVPTTLRTWTVIETILAVVALGVVLALDLVV